MTTLFPEVGRMPRTGGSQTVDRALSLLDALADSRSPLRLSDLSEAVGLNISTTSRLLNSLEQHGLIRRDASDGRYRLGYRILHMATVVEHQTSLHELADDVLHQLVDNINETSGLSVLDGDQVLVVARVACENQLRIAQPVGTRNPVYCTAAGKALLAFQPPERIEEILSLGMPKLTDLTITTHAAMHAEISRIREQGYALDLGEREVGLIGLSVPVRNASGTVVCTCTASGSSVRMTPDRIPVIRDRVMAAAAEISERLGWTLGNSINFSPSDSSKGES